MEKVFVFHAGTTLKDGQVITNGGRVLGVTGLGEDILRAIERTYQAVKKISWEGVYYRTDIGRKAPAGCRKGAECKSIAYALQARFTRLFPCTCLRGVPPFRDEGRGEGGEDPRWN
jgi:hypothetical protein